MSVKAKSFVIAIGLSFVIAHAALAAPDDICKSSILLPQEQSLCKDEIAGAETMTELRAVQKKFSDRVKAAEAEGSNKKQSKTDDEDVIRGIEVTDIYTRAMPEGATSTATYMTIKNRSAHFDRLTGIVTPLAEHVLIEQPVWWGLKMRLETVRKIDLPPGGEIILRPGHLQATLINTNYQLRPQVSVPIELHFERAGTIEVVSRVENKLLVN